MTKKKPEGAEAEPLVEKASGGLKLPAFRPPSKEYIQRRINKNSIVDGIGKAAHAVHDATDKATDKASHLVAASNPNKLLTKAKEGVVNRALSTAGNKVREGLTSDPWMPEQVKQSIATSFRYIWPEIENILIDLLQDGGTGQPKTKDRE